MGSQIIVQWVSRTFKKHLFYNKTALEIVLKIIHLESYKTFLYFHKNK